MTTPQSPPDAIVIGGGVAGLSAASALAEAGQRVLVLEARGHLGGRATAFRDRHTGERVDNGQHVLFGCYHETRRLLRRVGAEGHVRIQPALRVPFVGPRGEISALACPSWPAPFHLLAGILRWGALPWGQRLGALRLGPSLLRGKAAGAVEDTVEDWLSHYGQQGRIRQWLWEPLSVAALNEAPDRARADPFVAVLSRMFQGSRQNASMMLPTVPLDEMYAIPAQRYIEARGGAVRTHALARVSMTNGQPTVQVRGETLTARTVVAAVPWFTLGTLIGGEPGLLEETVARASRMTSNPIVTVNLWYDRDVMPPGEEFVGLPGRRIQWIFDKRAVFGESASHLSLVVSAADELVPLMTTEVVALAAAEVASALPLARTAVLQRGTVVREKQATFSVAPHEPARPGVGTPVRGFFLAGDWIETGLPATIESAAAAGHAAARAALSTHS